MSPKRSRANTSAKGRSARATLKVESTQVPVLREMVNTVTQECGNRLGMSASEIEAKSPTVDYFFDAIAADRLRRMPPDGSRLDGALRRASSLAFAVGSLCDAVMSFMDGAEEATRLIWGGTLLLLEAGIDQLDVLDSIFGRYGRVTMEISLLLQQERLLSESTPLQHEVAKVYANLLRLVMHVTMEYSEASRTQDWQTMGEVVDAEFFYFFNNFTSHWRRMSEIALSQKTSIDVASIYQFLGLQDRPLQMLFDGHNHSLADGSFEWVDPHLTSFTASSRQLMLITGDAGSGKSALAQWTTDRLQASSEYDIWNTIPFSVREDVPITTLPLTILKGFLLQMLDRCVSSWKTQQAILDYMVKAINIASTGATDQEVEDVLWSGIQTAMQSNMQFMILLDGLDQMKKANTNVPKFLGRLETAISHTPSKMIIFSREIPSKQWKFGGTMHKLSMTPAQTHDDMLAAVVDMISSDAQLYGLETNQMDSLAQSITARSEGSFVWAQLTSELVRHHTVFRDMMTTVQKAPRELGDLIDSHLNNIDTARPDIRYLLAWLVAAERPLRIREIDELLTVEPHTLKFTSRPTGPDRNMFKPLGRLVVVRDGFVSFRHPMIRQYLTERARSADSNYSSNQGFPFNLQEAHYDLLTRCLAWVRLSVKEEVEISMDKLSVDERNHFFDLYILLEYTSRYWFSHLLSSHMTTPEKEFSFTPVFKNSLPESVLFSQMELTSRESQFSRSSILELYRLSVAVRRMVLGQNSKAFLQSLILSARAADKAKAPWANDHLYEAWTLSRAQLGPSSELTTELEEMLVSTPGQAGQVNQVAGVKADALREMTLSGWDNKDISFSRRMEYLESLVQSYQDSNRNDEAYNVSKKFYQQTLDKYGAHSPESMQAADFMMQHFQLSSSDDLSLEVARIKYENMVRSMDATDSRRITYSLYLAQLYEENNKSKQAEGILTSLWIGLSSHDLQSRAAWDKKTKVAFVYYQFLRRHGRDDEAKVVIRELSSDLEAGGVHSQDMLERAQDLRSEAHELGLIDMEQALSMLIWKYYVSTGQQYSTEAVTLAESLAEDTMNKHTTSESMARLSKDERSFIHQLMDSIASSGSGRHSTSILTLCHNLCTVHIREEEWRQGSDCAFTVLKHEWPTVEEPTSDSKFRSDRAPLMANIALDHAYCLFRRLDVQTATVVYGNAFKASITADKVAIPHVTAVVKTVVEFYETTFQFSKALVLLHQVSEFFISRLGSSDKHTIDTLYYEGDLATRLDRQTEAEMAYRHIYNGNIRGGKVNSTAVRAAVALIHIYEQNREYDSALEVYRHLWPALVQFDEHDGYDRALLEGLLDKTYSGYMNTLRSSTITAEHSEKHQVASQYLKLCKKIHGPTSEHTRDATISQAKISGESDSHIDEAISLYQHVLDVNEWVPSSEASKPLPDMTETIPMDIKHKLAKLYLHQKRTSNEAQKLYMEELALSKQQHGLSSSLTLLWLREIALLYALKDTPESLQKGSDVLHDYVDEVIHVTTNHDNLIDRAHRLAEIYLECGYKDAGNDLIDELHQQVVHETPAAQRYRLDEHRPAVFVAAFEELFRKKMSYSQILDELSQESRVYSDFQQNLAGHDLIPTLIAGEKLNRLQTGQKRTISSKKTHDSLYEYFCNTLSVSSSMRKKDIIHQFYDICRREVMHSNYNINIIKSTTNMVRDLCNRSRFQEAADLTGVFHSFLHLTDGLHSHEAIFNSIKLCMYLNGYQTVKCTETATAKNMEFESKMLLQEIMSNAKDLRIEFSELPFPELNDLITVLGEHEMFDDLETILTDLWTSRIVQKTWSVSMVVWIGRRLVETRFCRGHVNAATQLGKHIYYNLRQVWGNCDPITLEMSKLLSGVYTASGNHLAATSLHEMALYELLNDPDVDRTANTTDTIKQHLELLKHAQSRLTKESNQAVDESAYEQLVHQVSTKFGLAEASLQQVSGTDDEVGVWQRPRRFSLDVEEQQMHSNHLRNNSGSVLLTGNAGAKRISITAL